MVVLKASPETIYRRTRRNKRVLLEMGDPMERIATLMAERRPAYEDVASVEVCTDAGNSQEVVEEIVAKLWEWRRAQERGVGG